MPPMSHHSLFRAAARCWERAGHFDRAAERYARADAWADAGRCWAQAGRFVDAADAYARAGEPIGEARQWLASPWPERARRPYRQALEMGLSTAAEVEALLGLGEIERASEQAFAVASENGRSVETLGSLARIAAARGRPDLAARAWGHMIAGSPAAAREVFKDWERAATWNRSLGWGRHPAEAPRWPSRAFRDVRLELVWEEKLGTMMYGNRGLAWSADGRRFAAVKFQEALILGNLTGRGVRHQSVEMEAISVAFIPQSDSVLVGCRGGQVVRVDAFGTAEDIERLKLSGPTVDLSFSQQGTHLAISGGPPSRAILRVWSWDSQGPREMMREEEQEGDRINPSCDWSPAGKTLVWCPGSWSKEAVNNDLYLFSDAGTRCVSAAHENGVNGIAFSPDGVHLVTVSLDRTLALRAAHTGEAVAPLRKLAQSLQTVTFHPHASLLAAGGLEDLKDLGRSGQFYLFRFSQANPPYLEFLQVATTETAVMSLAFSPDGEHLLMSMNDCLSLSRVHLI